MTGISPLNQYAFSSHAYVEIKIVQGSEVNQPQSPNRKGDPQSAGRPSPQSVYISIPGCSKMLAMIHRGNLSIKS